MSKQKKWQKFESLVAHIQGLLAPQAEITLNKKIRGKRSKTLREIDIAVSQNIGQHHIFIAIDCKDYKSPVDVKNIEEFIGLVEDVGANKGAIVSANGFTQAAKTRAADAGIDIYRLVDAEKHDWQSRILIPALLDIRKIKSFNVNTGPFKITQDPETIILFNQNGEPIDTTLNLLYKKWNARLFPFEPGEYTDIKLTDVTPFIKIEGKLCQLEVTVNICVEKDLY
ncbi:MAG: restriction endonuclease, partial [Candidatus Brocadiales bacterium]|nr:restriction endonuclease [Candidatus Brocadiales bacterium]